MTTHPTERESKLIDAELTYAIIGAFYRVYNALGPGLLEVLYSRALQIVLREYGLIVDREHPVPVLFEGHQIGFHRIDMLVEKRVILELKSCDVLPSAAKRQLRSYLGVTGLELGVLLHFGPDESGFKPFAARR